MEELIIDALLVLAELALEPHLARAVWQFIVFLEMLLPVGHLAPVRPADAVVAQLFQGLSNMQLAVARIRHRPLCRLEVVSNAEIGRRVHSMPLCASHAKIGRKDR